MIPDFAAKMWGRLAAIHNTSPGVNDMASIAELRPASNSHVPEYRGIMEMTPEAWIDIEDNPRQRDTEARAKRARHLREPHPTHSRVNMARLPDGRAYKLDGHTRAHLWASRKLEPPPKVYADVWNCSSLDEVKGLYGTFDSKAALETTTDQVFGAVREQHISFESELLKSQRFAGAMRVANNFLFGNTYTNERTLYELFEYWLPELKLFDECMPTRRRFHTGVAAAALISFRRYGPEAAAFWKTFAIGGGIKLGTEMDAVQALEQRMESVRFEKQVTGSGNITKIIRICLSAFDAYRRDHSYAAISGIKALQDNSFNRWLTATAKTKRRW